MSRTTIATRRIAVKRIAALGVSLVAATALVAGCSGSSSDDAASSSNAPSGSVVVGALSNGAAQEVTLTVPQVDSIRAELPAQVRDSGRLVVGLGLLPSGSPPLGFIGTDEQTLTGVEPDLGRLVAAVFGLQPVLTNATWDNLFVGIDSGRSNVGFSNITVTEARKEKYDFATYRKDNLGFEALKTSTWNFDGNPEVLAGKTIAVDTGTNQEKLLITWQEKLKQEGKTLNIKYFADKNSTQLALSSGQIDAYLQPNPSVAYHVRQTASGPHPTRSAGTYSGAGETLQGLIAATTKKDSGLVKPLSDAINYLITNGQYEKWLAAWNLSNEAIPTSQINPPGLPRTNS